MPVPPLTAAVLSGVGRDDEGLASGINNALSRIAQLGGIALSAGMASYALGLQLGLVAAGALSLVGAGITAAMLRSAIRKRGAP